MGKSKKPKQEVTQYFMSEHFGVCSGPIDSLLSVIINEKEAWAGSASGLSRASISQPELFGGVKKEGGVEGIVTLLSGESDQVMPDDLATRLGRASGAECPAFRGISSLFFTGTVGTNTSESTPPSSGGTWSGIFSVLVGKVKTANAGFYWTANSPYLPGVWAKVQRIFLRSDGTSQWYPEKAAIAGSGSVGESVVLSETASFKYKIVDATDTTDYSDPDLDDSSWSVGSGPFGNSTHPSLELADWASPGTAVPTSPLKAVWLRYNSLPANIDRIQIASDNDAQLYLNGVATSLTADGLWLFNASVANSNGVRLALRVEDTGPVGSGNYVYAGLRGINAGSGYSDMNPAHIIHEALTNADWGMGTPASALDEDAFTDAADTLFAEAFGLSMIWTRQTSIEDFIQEVLDHIQAVLYADPSTGLLTLKLIRGDYVESSLPVLDPDNADLTNFSRKLHGDIVNEITVTWTNPANEQEETVTAQDLASIASQGAPVSDSRNYYGVRNADLATMLSYRDLRSAGQPLSTCEVETDRTFWNLRPASVVKVTWPEYGLDELVMRVTSIDYGKPGDPTIKMALIEDVYGLDLGAYDSPPATEWTDPAAEPTVMAPVDIFTLPYFMSGDVTAGLDPAYPDVAVGILATTDNSDTYDYSLVDEVTLSNGDTSTESLGDLNVIGRGTLVAPLVPEASSAGVTFADVIGNTSPVSAGFAIIGEDGEEGNEIAQFATVGATYTLTRGVLDTVPRAWPAGTPVWFVDESTVFEDPLLRSAGETVDYKLLARTSRGVLDYASAPLESATLSERPYLPTRPANVTAYGEAWSDETNIIDAVDRANPWVTVTWANRNRLTEDTVILDWDDADVTPETGQTTTIQVCDADGVEIALHDGLTGTTFDVPDASFGTETIVRLRVKAERSDADGDFVSLQHFEHWVQVGPLTADSTLVTADSTTWMADEG